MNNHSIQAVGLDIGTSRVRCVIGEGKDDGKLSIVGFAQTDSRGLRRGIVTTTNSVVESIKKAVEEAERMSGLEIQLATVNLSGEHLQGQNKSGVVAVAGTGREITNDDVDRAIESATAIQLPAGWEIADRLPQEFIIDGQDGIIEPVGMRGSRLEALVHIVTSPSAGGQNIVKAIHNSGLEIEEMMLEPLAAATSTLSDEDREYGCALVNIGAEITSLMIFGRGAVQHTAVFPFGGMHFTKDIATGLRVSIPEAEEIKHQMGCVAGYLMSEEEKQQIIEITPVGRSETRQLTKEILCDILQPRGIELLQHIAQEVAHASSQISSGVILTGGTSSIRGIVEVAEQVFDAPTRIGFPQKRHFAGLIDELESPEWAVATGLALSSMRSQIREYNSGGKSPTRKVAEWFENFRGKFR
ncbi:MAG: cell division protein FtsA [Acidobacteriota bacterium]|jgi:cell division protein FtsA|nr:cell division protein FtsA [Acidobacteriota bacterium]